MKYLMQLLVCTVFACSSAFAADEPLTFELESSKGMVQPKDFPGKYLLIAVGYTTCPDVCPTTLLEMKGALAYLESKKLDKKIVPLFITIDPNKDSVENLTKYTAYFDPRITGLRAKDAATLNDIVGQLNASYGYKIDGKEVSLEDLTPKSKYDVYHSTYIYLYGPERQLVDVFSYGMGGDELGHKLEGILK